MWQPIKAGICGEIMEPRCPYYKAPRLLTDPKTDKSYEGSAMCDLTDKYCQVEYGNACDEYNEFLKEEENDK